MNIKDKLKSILEGTHNVADGPTEEFEKEIEELIDQEAPLILDKLGIKKSEWDYDKRFWLIWQPNHTSMGRTGNPDPNIKLTFKNADVFLYIKNIIRYGPYKDFTHNFISTMAHEFKHIQQLKNGYDHETYVSFDDDKDSYKNQNIEKEADAFAIAYLKERGFKPKYR